MNVVADIEKNENGSERDQLMRHLNRYRKVTEFLAECRNYYSSPELLDIGCNNGFMLQLCRSYFGMVGKGVDISAECIERCRSAGFKCMHMNINDRSLPFANGSFDIVLCCEVLEHLTRSVSVLKEIARILKPNGRTIITVPNAVSFRKRIAVLRGKNPISIWREFISADFHPHLHEFTAAEISEMGSYSGLIPERIDGVMENPEGRGVSRRLIYFLIGSTGYISFRDTFVIIYRKMTGGSTNGLV